MCTIYVITERGWAYFKWMIRARNVSGNIKWIYHAALRALAAITAEHWKGFIRNINYLEYLNSDPNLTSPFKICHLY